MQVTRSSFSLCVDDPRQCPDLLAVVLAAVLPLLGELNGAPWRSAMWRGPSPGLFLSVMVSFQFGLYLVIKHIKYKNGRGNFIKWTMLTRQQVAEGGHIHHTYHSDFLVHGK